MTGFNLYILLILKFCRSFDIIISNCVINLSPDKLEVLKGVFKLLKPGGELYFSDVYSSRRIPKVIIVRGRHFHSICKNG